MGDMGDSETTRVCRDFMRNVCGRGSNCKFIHPDHVQIKTDPIFCHDFQQGECISKRKLCKFIHCSREEEEHYKQTGELPESASGTEYYERPARGAANGNNSGRKTRGSSNGGSQGRGRNGFNSNRNGSGRNMDSNYGNNDNSEIPVCKDYLKGQCGRAAGRCKFRHVSVESQSYGGGGGGGNRRRVSTSYYDSGPETKRNHYSTDYFDFSSNASPPPPPPQQNFYSQNQTAYQDGSHGHTSNNNNGYSTINQLSDMSTAITSFSTSVSSVSANNDNNTATATAMKALEDENFMLKRRIEELKKNVSDLVATNEYLLSQNAHFRINNMTKEVQVGVGVQGQVVSMAQPIAIQNSSLSCSVAASAPGLSTITSIPTVSMTPVSSLSNHSISLTASPVVSMAQQHPSQPTVYPIGAVLPPN